MTNIDLARAERPAVDRLTDQLRGLHGDERTEALTLVAGRFGPDVCATVRQRLDVLDAAGGAARSEPPIRRLEEDRFADKLSAAIAGRAKPAEPPVPPPPPPAIADKLDEAISAQAKPKLRPEPGAEPKPPPQSPGETSSPAGDRPQIDGATGTAILNPQAPYDNAKEFVRQRCKHNGLLTAFYWQSLFWHWNGQHFVQDGKDELILRGMVFEFLNNAKRWAVGGNTQRFQPKPVHVNEIVDCLKHELAMPVEHGPPMWLDQQGGATRATEWIAFANGVVNVETGEMRQHSPAFWTHSSLGFDWRPEAEAPRWAQFLNEVFPDDAQSQAFIEEWMGYCMTEETRFQKAALLIGKRRAGKSTITHMLKRLVGERCYVPISLNTWTSTENSGEDLIGKRVGVFGDVRLKQGRAYGTSYDPGGMQQPSVERLLQITGEDTIRLGRKFIGAWHGQLRIKIVMVSNEMIVMNDATLPTRFIKAYFGVCFEGNEDGRLRDKLEAEIVGIAARCVRAYQQLCSRGYFIQPESGLGLDRNITAVSDPFAAMAEECFVADPKGEVVHAVAYSVFEQWCTKNKRHELRITIPANRFGTRLRELPGFAAIRLYKPHGKQRRLIGIRIRKSADMPDDAW